jgi:hypothetical protein
MCRFPSDTRLVGFAKAHTKVLKRDEPCDQLIFVPSNGPMSKRDEGVRKGRLAMV